MMNATCKSSGPAFSLTLFSPARNFAVFRTGSNGSALMNVTCKSSGPNAPSTSFSQTFILLLLLSDSLFSDSNQMGLAGMVPTDYSFDCLTLGCYCCRLNYSSLYKVFRRQQNYFSKEFISLNRIVLLGSHRKRFYKGKYHHHLEEVQTIC